MRDIEYLCILLSHYLTISISLISYLLSLISYLLLLTRRYPKEPQRESQMVPNPGTPFQPK